MWYVLATDFPVTRATRVRRTTAACFEGGFGPNMDGGKAKVLAAFETSRHRWRTARGIARDTKLPLAQVTKLLHEAPEVVRARKPDARGEALFGLRDKRSSAASDANDSPAPSLGGGERQRSYLVLIPHGAAADRLKDAITRAVYQGRGTPVFLNESLSGASRVDTVGRVLRSADAVIADLTRGNANVMFELGVAHGLGKPLILLLDATADTSVPSDLLGSVYLTYTPQNLSELTSRLARTVHGIAVTREGQ